MNKGGSKGQTPVGTGDMTPLCYKFGGHGHYVVVCPGKGLHFCVEELESKSESYSKEEETHNESNSNGSCKKWGVKCHFEILNSVLAPLNSVFAPIVGAKKGVSF